MLKIENIKKTYKMGDNEVKALRDVSLTIEQGDFVAIMGPSGSGKSTLMHILGLLDVPTSGSYQVEGREVSNHSEDELAVLRREVIGFVFQQFNLLPRMTALENVVLPLLYSQKKADLPYGKELLERIGLGSRAHHRPSELSGGQQQRVAIARSLVNRPKLILADEPTGNLDSVSEKEILKILKDLNDQGITVVIVTHEEEVGRHTKRLIKMRDGTIQSDERLSPLNKPTHQGLAHSSPIAIKSGFSDYLEYFKQGYQALAGNKIRTVLSMLGILIGVASVVAMLALGRGAQKSIEASLTSLGSNLLVLRSGSNSSGGVRQQSGSVPRLTLEDADVLKFKIDALNAVSPTVSDRAQLTYQDKNWNSYVVGGGISYASIHALEPAYGRFFTESENQNHVRVAVIGMTVVRELFGGDTSGKSPSKNPLKNPIGEFIKINKVNFQVIGILPEKGGGGWRDQDDTVIIPIETAMKRLFGKMYVDYIDLEVKTPELIDPTYERILDVMYSRHRVPPSQQESAYEIRNMADIQNALSESSKTMGMLLSAIAAISLLVGGIGIMNIMLVSVTERTREIGLRKAVGARKVDILAQFLSESVVVSALGGIFGIMVGWLITFILSIAAGWNTSITLSSVLLAFVFSATIGIIFGIYPARKASRLHPIDALRHD